MKIYIGDKDYDTNIQKIGFTEQTCWARCKHSDYTIYGAFGFEAPVSDSEKLFLESYLRMSFNSMKEVEAQIKTDYFLVNLDPTILKVFPDMEHVAVPKKNDPNPWREWSFSWFEVFVKEAIKIINFKRTYTNTKPITENDYWVIFDEVRPYYY